MLGHTALPQKLPLCIACHGQDGIGQQPMWPNLAGQHARFLVKQLQDIKQQTTRKVPLMQGIMRDLTEEDLTELANYYAQLPRFEGHTPKRFVARGQALYRGGDMSRHIPACIACHGPQGFGNEAANFPVLSGQHALYTILQLKAFANHERTNDLNHMMQTISHRLDDADIQAVAYYLQGLH